MITYPEAIDHLLTWLDVERLLKQNTALWTRMPEGILGIDCFADGMDVRHSSDASHVNDWLCRVFGQAYLRDEHCIRLRIAEALYPVELVREEIETKETIVPSYPLWREVVYLPTTVEDKSSRTVDPIIWSDTSINNPSMLSFHSFKGGVGRTSALMTYVAACMRESGDLPTKILIVDADLEAPGVSFWLEDVNRPKVSFVQLLEALHYPPSGINDTLDFFAEELRKTSLNIGGMQRELFILPAALNLADIEDMPIAPEHIARNPSNPWQLTDHLHSLGQKLGVDAVFIDLRAGLSELASPILFDPRVDHFFVSTVAPQSVFGMAEILSRLYAFNYQLPSGRQDETRPTVILSLLTKELLEAGNFERALQTLSGAYPSDDPLTPSVEWLEAEFLSSLMSIGSVREALEVLPQSNRLFSSAREWAKSLYAARNLSLQPVEIYDDSSDALVGQTQANRLYEVCNRAEFADSGDAAPILATEPLLNLGKQYAKETPNVLMIGAKGAGKTFTYRQLVRSKSWQSFLGKLGFNSANILDAAIFPIIWSSNIEDKPNGEIKVAQSAALELIACDKPLLFTNSDISRRIQDALKSPPEHWGDFWDSLITKQFGIDDGNLQKLNTTLATQSRQIIFVFDGIEDVFEDATEENAVNAIQALLRLPNRISELENRHIGVIVFVRADYLQATVRQNLGQLLQRFQSFRLQWNPESFLRLAYMLSCQAGIYDDDPKAAETLRIEELKTKLEKLWGRKLGREKSKEAHSARWVYSALCDLKGNVQARDLVRFLKFSASHESTRAGATWPDRILAPESMRKAIPLCSKEKVDEAKQEIAPLRKWSDLMEQHGIRNIKVPFSKEEVKLDNSLLVLLQEIGVIYEDLDGNLGEQRLFLPEIYREGLGFETSATGRPRTQALLKKNIGSIPL
jgi:hypothetical protein